MNSSISNEIITIQCGHFANFVGAHFWNFQESNCYSDASDKNVYQYDVLFHEGETVSRQTTYTPRLLLVDYKGSLGALPQAGGLYDDPQPDNELAWHGDVEISDTGPAEKNDFMKALDEEEMDSNAAEHASSSSDVPMEGVATKENVNVQPRESTSDLTSKINTWSDFLKPFFHHKSMTVIKEHSLNSNFCGGMDSFSEASELFERYSEEFEEKLFYMLEKCDSLQGFSFLTDVYDGIGGFSSGICCLLADELPKKSVVMQTCNAPSKERFKKHKKDCINNCVMTLSSVLQHGSVVIPYSTCPGWLELASLGYPEALNMEENAYHKSSVLATAMHSSCSSLYLSEGSSMKMDDFTDLLGIHSRKVVSVYSSFPHFPESDDKSILSTLRSFSPTSQALTAPVSLLSTFCGAQKDYSTVWSSVVQSSTRFVSRSCLTGAPVLFEQPFPKIFKKNPEFGRRKVPIFSVLSNCGAAATGLEELHSVASHVKVPSLKGMESDLYQEALEVIANAAGQYQESSY